MAGPEGPTGWHFRSITAIRQADLVAVLRKLPRASRRRSAREAAWSPAARGSGSASPAPCCAPGCGWRSSTSRSADSIASSGGSCWPAPAGSGRERTLLCVTHDVGETLEFERVLVIENGRVVEDGPPAGPGGATRLALRRPCSRQSATCGRVYGASAVWRRLVMERGRLTGEERRRPARRAMDLDAARLWPAWPARLRRSRPWRGAGGLNPAKLSSPSRKTPRLGRSGALDRRRRGRHGARSRAGRGLLRRDRSPRPAAPARRSCACPGRREPRGSSPCSPRDRRTGARARPRPPPRRVPVAAARRAPPRARCPPRTARSTACSPRRRVPARRRGAGRAAILAERLAASRIGGCWLLDLPPGGSFWAAARRARLPGRAAVLVGAHVVQHALLLVSWWLLGRGVLAGAARLAAGCSPGRCCCSTVIPFRTLELWSAGVLMARAGCAVQAPADGWAP